MPVTTNGLQCDPLSSADVSAELKITTGPVLSGKPKSNFCMALLCLCMVCIKKYICFIFKDVEDTGINHKHG